MIKVKRTNIPDILQRHQHAWTTDLLSLIFKYGGYDKIPNPIKDKAVNKYHEQEIKEAVVEITKGKCIYCESYIQHIDFPHIEHFYPKAIYPKYTFKWSNLFPACTVCNITKGDFDTKQNPIVNPETDDPESYFVFRELRIEPSATSPNPEKSKNTIHCCQLNRLELSKIYAKLLLGLYDVEENLEEKMKEYHLLRQSHAKLLRVIAIKAALDNLKDQMQPDKSDAGFLRYYIKQSKTINSAAGIINNHQLDLHLVSSYDLLSF
jgi:uncharacterized protein (TIGR02646 family)